MSIQGEFNCISYVTYTSVIKPLEADTLVADVICSSRSRHIAQVERAADSTWNKPQADAKVQRGDCVQRAGPKTASIASCVDGD